MRIGATVIAAGPSQEKNLRVSIEFARPGEGRWDRAAKFLEDWVSLRFGGAHHLPASSEPGRVAVYLCERMPMRMSAAEIAAGLAADPASLWHAIERGALGRAPVSPSVGAQCRAAVVWFDEGMARIALGDHQGIDLPVVDAWRVLDEVRSALIEVACTAWTNRAGRLP